MNGNVNSRLRLLLTRLHPLLSILAAPRQQTVVDICSRTVEVQTAILAKVSGATCLTSTSTQLAAITGTLAGLTALTTLNLNNNGMASPPVHADHRLDSGGAVVLFVQ